MPAVYSDTSNRSGACKEQSAIAETPCSNRKNASISRDVRNSRDREKVQAGTSETVGMLAKVGSPAIAGTPAHTKNSGDASNSREVSSNTSNKGDANNSSDASIRMHVKGGKPAVTAVEPTSGELQQQLGRQQ
jgi:hypothetical protein